LEKYYVQTDGNTNILRSHRKVGLLSNDEDDVDDQRLIEV